MKIAAGRYVHIHKVSGGAWLFVRTVIHRPDEVRCVLEVADNDLDGVSGTWHCSSRARRRRGRGLADRQRNAPPLNIFATLARHPDLFEAWMPLIWQLNDGLLPAADREIVILRTALRCGAHYEWDQHAPVAHSVGLLSSDLAAVVRGPADAHWAPRQRALLRLVDELHATTTVSDHLWQDLTAHYDERQLIELIMLVGIYHQVAFALNALRVPTDAWVDASTFPGIPAS